MSEGGFHVHGPHDHAVEHVAQHGDPFAGRIAVMTAMFATITILTRSKGLSYAAFVAAGVAIAIGVLATLHI